MKRFENQCFSKWVPLQVCKSDSVQMEIMEQNGILHVQVCNSDSAHMEPNRPLHSNSTIADRQAHNTMGCVAL